MDFVIPIAGVALVGSFLALLTVLAKNYIKVPPNRVAIFYGRWREIDGQRVGFRVITGGARLRLPLVESVTYLDLNMFPIELGVKAAPNKDGVRIDVRGVANVKVLSDEASLMAACERFLGMPPQDIRNIAYQNLEGHLRAIIGQLTVEDLVFDRTKLNQAVLREAAEDLKKIGLGVDVLTIQEVDDEYGYIKALGQRRTAEVMRDAEIGKAQAERDATMQATTARREAEQTARQNDALVAEAEKELNVKKAQYDALIAAEQARAGQASALATAQARQQVIQAATTLATAEAARKGQELLATVVRPAEAERQAMIAQAEGKREVVIKSAEAEKEAARLRGEGEAAGIQARGRAEAEVIKARLLAEAEGILRKAEAYATLGEKAQTLLILEQVGKTLPEALEKLGPIMAEIARPLGSVDRISLVDIGGNGADGGSIGQFVQTVPLVLLKFVETMKAAGLDPQQLLHLIGTTQEPTGSEVLLPAVSHNSVKE